MRRTRRIWRAMAGLGLCTATVAGCTLGAASPQNGPDDGPRQVRELTEREKDLLSHAEALLTGACMRERGFRYVVLPPSTYPDSVRDFPYGIDDVAWARRHGFGSQLRRTVQRQAARDPNPRYLRSLSEKRGQAYMDALAEKKSARVSVELPGGYTVSGSTKGCAPEAQRALYRDFEGWFRSSTAVDSLASEYQAKVTGHRDYRAALDRWSDCMSDRGYRVAHPGRLRETEAAETEREPTAKEPTAKEPTAKEPTAKELAREKKAATAEARCARQSGLADTAHQLEKRYKAEVRAARKKQIRQHLTLAHEALPRAREVIKQRAD
ncbi:hypothetical protein U9R90_16860 [Streptomyces sp. E11-3]|uniref:hypothetical protein n=1 Tax=Streptomyces sp. E11-3 TaxID=3110112 RepID=UPI00397F05D0